MNDQLRQAAINAGAKLQAMTEAQDAYARAYTAWEVANLRIVTDRKDTKIEYDMAIEALRKAVLAEYEATGNKHPGAGTGIRVSQRVVVDEPAALRWAETNAPIMVKRALDRKAFDAYAKANPGSVGTVARIDEEITPTIPSDLLSALEAAGLTLPEPPDLLGAEPEVGFLPADPRYGTGYAAALNAGIHINEMLERGKARGFTPLDPDTLPRVDKPTIGGEQ